MRCCAALLLLLVFGGASTATADDVRPATLQVREVSTDRFDVRWQTPMRGRSRRKGVLLGLYDGDEVDPELTVKYRGPAA